MKIIMEMTKRILHIPMKITIVRGEAGWKHKKRLEEFVAEYVYFAECSLNKQLELSPMEESTSEDRTVAKARPGPTQIDVIHTVSFE